MNQPFLWTLLNIALALVCAPLLPALSVKVCAWCSGCSGPSIWKNYAELVSLFRSRTLYSGDSTLVSRMVPVGMLTIFLLILGLLPVTATLGALFAFPGDFILLIGLLALGRFISLAAAMDSGDPLMVLSVSRLLPLYIFPEPTLFLSMVTVVVLTKSSSLSGIWATFEIGNGQLLAPALLTVFPLFALMLFENAQAPFESQENPFELTRTTTNLYRDFSGWELGILRYSGSLKFWIYGWLTAFLALPHTMDAMWDYLLHFPVPFLLSAAAGVIAAFRPLTRIRHLSRILLGALVIAALALIFAVVSAGTTRGGF